MRLNTQRPKPPQPLLGAPPWSPESYQDMVDLVIGDLPVTKDPYPDFENWNFLYSIRLASLPENRKRVVGLLREQYEHNPSSGFLNYTGEPGLNVMVFERTPTDMKEGKG